MGKWSIKKGVRWIAGGLIWVCAVATRGAHNSTEAAISLRGRQKLCHLSLEITDGMSGSRHPGLSGFSALLVIFYGKKLYVAFLVICLFPRWTKFDSNNYVVSVSTFSFFLQWRIQDFPEEGVLTPRGRGAPTYYLANFSQKLHENEEILGQRGGASLVPPLDLPLFWVTTHLHVSVLGKEADRNSARPN